MDRALPHRVNIRGAAITRNECIRRRLDALNRTGFGGNLRARMPSGERKTRMSLRAGNQLSTAALLVT